MTERLGFSKYVAQGGDWGALNVVHLGRLFPEKYFFCCLLSYMVFLILFFLLNSINNCFLFFFTIFLYAYI